MLPSAWQFNPCYSTRRRSSFDELGEKSTTLYLYVRVIRVLFTFCINFVAFRRSQDRQSISRRGTRLQVWLRLLRDLCRRGLHFRVGRVQSPTGRCRPSSRPPVGAPVALHHRGPLQDADGQTVAGRDVIRFRPEGRCKATDDVTEIDDRLQVVQQGVQDIQLMRIWYDMIWYDMIYGESSKTRRDSSLKTMNAGVITWHASYHVNGCDGRRDAKKRSSTISEH